RLPMLQAYPCTGQLVGTVPIGHAEAPLVFAHTNRTRSKRYIFRRANIESGTDAMRWKLGCSDRLGKCLYTRGRREPQITAKYGSVFDHLRRRTKHSIGAVCHLTETCGNVGMAPPVAPSEKGSCSRG